MMLRQVERGYLMIYVLVFASVFMVILTSFLTFIVTQSKLIEQRVRFEQAGQIAEAGLNYYKWYLAHYPNSTTTAITGVYSDPELGPIGEYQLSLASTTFCGTIMSRQVQSLGYTYAIQRSGELSVRGIQDLMSPNIHSSLTVVCGREMIGLLMVRTIVMVGCVWTVHTFQV
jgi:hypothetical protein